MDVLFLSPVVPWPPRSGGRIRTLELLRALRAHHGSARVHLRAVEDPVPVAHTEVEPLVASFASFPRSEPKALERIARPKLARWFHSELLETAVRDELRKLDFDLVHVDEMFLVPAVPTDCGVPLVVHHHKLDVELAVQTGSSGYDLAKLRRLERDAARRTPHHVLASDLDAERLSGRHEGLRCHVVPNGVDPEAFRPGDGERERDRLLFVGSLDYEPNVDALEFFVRDVLPRVAERRAGVRLAIVGSHDEGVRSAYADHERVEVVGEVEDVRPELARAAVSVVPLRIGGGSRLKIAEALAAGCPVVATTVGAQGLDLVDGEHLSLADGSAAFAAAVVELLEDPLRAAGLTECGRERVLERHTWQRLAGSLLEAWRAAVENT